MSGVTTIPLPGETLESERTKGRSAPRVVLRSYYAGPENAVACVAIESLLAAGGSRWSPLVLLGPAEVGKSHLARGIAKRWKSSGRTGHVACVTGSQFSQELASAIDNGRMTAFRTKFRGAALFVLEELESLAGRSTALDELEFTLDALARSEATVVITSRVSPGEIAGLPAAIVSRLNAGLAVPLSLPEAETRLAILRELATLRGIALSERAARALADSLKLSVPKLLDSLIQIGEGDAVIDAGSAETFLAGRARGPLDLSEIAKAAAQHFSLKPAALKTASRNRTVVTARGIAMYLARSLTRQTLEQIGEYFGGRDHTTVMYNCEKMARLVGEDREVRQAVAQIRQKLEK